MRAGIAAALTFAIWWPLLSIGFVVCAGWIARWRLAARWPTTAMVGVALTLAFLLAAWGAYGAYIAPIPFAETLL